MLKTRALAGEAKRSGICCSEWEIRGDNSYNRWMSLRISISFSPGIQHGDRQIDRRKKCELFSPFNEHVSNQRTVACGALKSNFLASPPLPPLLPLFCRSPLFPPPPPPPVPSCIHILPPPLFSPSFCLLFTRLPSCPLFYPFLSPLFPSSLVLRSFLLSHSFLSLFLLLFPFFHFLTYFSPSSFPISIIFSSLSPSLPFHFFSILPLVSPSHPYPVFSFIFILLPSSPGLPLFSLSYLSLTLPSFLPSTFRISLHFNISIPSPPRPSPHCPTLSSLAFLLSSPSPSLSPLHSPSPLSQLFFPLPPLIAINLSSPFPLFSLIPLNSLSSLPPFPSPFSSPCSLSSPSLLFPPSPLLSLPSFPLLPPPPPALASGQILSSYANA
ncbi:hypothetical protein C7M84_004564 [Penaeus vannamei]|uniref:Uncharacterized protein n=1 Tax=Penaeus vannamei TaxID=6689 RepID=A0A423TK39_PENVA|nr:hypothetical protein C7M84_004564 [Penaeus vannamei]